MHDMRVGEFVERDRVAVAAAFRQRQRLRRRHGERLSHVLRGQQRPGAARPHRMRVAPDLEIPVGDRAIGVERGLQLRHHRRAIGLPAMLLLAHPLHANRNARQCARDQGCVGRGIVGAIVAITAGALDMDQTHACRRHAQHLGDALAIRIDALGMGPDRHRCRRPTARPRRTARSSHATGMAAYRSLPASFAPISRRIALLENRQSPATAGW